MSWRDTQQGCILNLNQPRIKTEGVIWVSLLESNSADKNDEYLQTLHYRLHSLTEQTYRMMTLWLKQGW